MIKAFKIILNSILEARKFNTTMRLLGAINKKTKTIKVKITENQMEMLANLALYGIRDQKQLDKIINYRLS